MRHFQEKLEEQLNVSGQTISKRKLGETSPNLKGAKELACIFQVGLDELARNDVKEILIEKASNTENLSGFIIKILKFVGFFLLLMLMIEILRGFYFFQYLNMSPYQK